MKTVLQSGAERAREGRARLHDEVVLDRYRLCERLGSGGFGTVWRGHDERLDREVAVKRIPRAAGDRGSGRGEDDRRRASREVLAAARLSHPGIVALYEAGADDGAYYIVSELVHGRTLAELFAGDELSDCEIADIGAALADALAHAHTRGIVHRDVKPQNVIVPGEPGRSAWPKLTDFGVARIAGSEPLTRTGDVVGTLAYMAPEQAAGHAVGPQADLFSLALVVYEGLAGFNPARGDSPAETARRLGRPLPPLARTRRDLPPAPCAALDRALSLDPARRGTLADLRAGLLEARESLDFEAPGAPARAPARERSQRRPWLGRAAVAPLAPPQRLFAGASAAALTAAALAWIGPRAPVAPWWALVAGAAVALLPRAGWIATAAAAVCWLLFAGEPGTAMLLALALALVPLLLPRSPTLWSLPALAPSLGALGVAAAFPAVVGQLRGSWRRISLAALGLWWLLLAEPVLGRRLLLGVAAGTRDRHSWQGSAVDAFDHALVPLVRGGALSVALVWALAALVLPPLLRARRTSGHALIAALWTLAVAGATAALAQAMRPQLASPRLVWLVPGAAAAVAAVVLGCALRDSRRAPAPVAEPV